MRSLALRAVPLPEPSVEQFALPVSEGEAHSLYSLLGYLSSLGPELSAHLIQRYSHPGESVADLCCLGGDFLLEAALLGRQVFGADSEPYFSYVAGARTKPADICQIALALQMIPLTRPLDVRLYSEEFQPFYDLMTFREIHHIRSLVLGSEGYVERFLGALVLSILHGPSSSYLSTYSSPYMSIHPEAQLTLNQRRGQYPTHRQLSPRVLKRAAHVLRDGIPQRLGRFVDPHAVQCTFPWDLSHIATGSLSLAVVSWDAISRFCEQTSLVPVVRTELEKAGSVRRQSVLSAEQQWLRRWFLNCQVTECSEKPFGDLIAEVFLEAARVSKSGGRLVFECQSPSLVSACAEVVQSDLGRFWHVESFVDFETTEATEAQPAWAPSSGQLLVLRRLTV